MSFTGGFHGGRRSGQSPSRDKVEKLLVLFLENLKSLAHLLAPHWIIPGTLENCKNAFHLQFSDKSLNVLRGMLMSADVPVVTSE